MIEGLNDGAKAKSDPPSVKCLCQKIIQLDKIVEHAKLCSNFKLVFGSLPEAVDSSLKAAKDVESCEVLWYFFTHAKECCKKKIRAQKASAPSAPSIPEPVPPMPEPVHVPEPEPRPADRFSPKNAEEEKHVCEMMEQSGVRCGVCKTWFLDFNQIMYLQMCLHPFCKEDLKSAVFRDLPKEGIVTCPAEGCKSSLLKEEIEILVGKEAMEKLLDKYAKSSVEKMGLTQCPKCKNMWEQAEGKIDSKQKDEKGNLLSKKAAEHFAKYRARCPQEGCHTIFCAKCQAEPYHMGYTCEEYKNYQSARKCRYCKEKIDGEGASPLPVFRNVCRKPECMALMAKACDKILPCGHPCYGFRGEKHCLPCLNEECVKKNSALTKGQKEDDYCPICYTTGLGDSPSVMPECGHICHVECLYSRIKKRWPGPRITFSFCECPMCRAWANAPQHPEINAELMAIKEIHAEIKKKALDRLKYEGLDKDERLRNPKDKFYNKFEEYAMTRLSYYMCFKCHKPYFGGLKSCENVNEGRGEYKEEDLVCGACASTNIKGGALDCKLHGKEFIEFKCRFCCSVAQWFCWGTTHFCEPCHSKQCKGEYLSKKTKDQLPKCPGMKGCPLKIAHPPNGEEYSLGCAICRNNQANIKPF